MTSRMTHCWSFFSIFRSVVLPWFILISLITLIAVLTKVINLELCSWYQRIALAVLIGFSPGLQAFVMVSITGYRFQEPMGLILKMSLWEWLLLFFNPSVNFVQKNMLGKEKTSVLKQRKFTKENSPRQRFGGTQEKWLPYELLSFVYANMTDMLLL